MKTTADERTVDRTIAVIEDLDAIPLSVIASSGMAKLVLSEVAPDVAGSESSTVAWFNSFIASVTSPE